MTNFLFIAFKELVAFNILPQDLHMRLTANADEYF